MRITTDLGHTESGATEPLPKTGRRPLAGSSILQLLPLRRINVSLAQRPKASAKAPKTLQNTASERRKPR
jgi:hypothetical protein